MPTMKGIKNAFGRFANKFRRRTKKQDNSKKNRIKYSNTNEQVKNRHRINQYVELTNKLSGCEHNLPILVTQNAQQQQEINALKHTIQNYERIAADSDKLNRELQDELAQCQSSKSRKLGSSGRRGTNLHSQALHTVGPTSQISQHTGLTSSSVRRSVKSGSRRTSKLIQSRKPALNTIPELNKPTESSSKRRARLAKQNEMVRNVGNFLNTHMKAYTQKRKEINNAKAAEKAAANQAAANAKQAANNALRNKKLAHIGMMRRGG